MPARRDGSGAERALSDAISQLDGGGPGEGLRGRQDQDTRIQVAGRQDAQASTTPTAVGVGAARAGDWSGTAGGGMTRDPGQVDGGDGSDFGETAHDRLQRLTQQVLQGERTLDDIRGSVDNIYERHGTTWDDYAGPGSGYQGIEGDDFYLDQGAGGVRERIQQIFGNRGVALDQQYHVADRGETEGERLHRIAQEVASGARDFDDVRQSVDLLAQQTDPDDLWTSYEGPSEGFQGIEGDDWYMQQGEDAIRERVRQIFGNRMVPVGRQGETGGELESGVIPRERGYDDRDHGSPPEPDPGEQRIARIADEVLAGQRGLDDVRQSVEGLHQRHGTTWDDYGGPSSGFQGIEGDDFYLDQGRDAVIERIRQIFGNRGVALDQQY